MKKLKELISLIDLNKTKSIEIIDKGIDSDTKLMQLYNGIRKGKVTSDEEAMAHLYPDGSNRNAYYKLKHTLRERLFNTIFFIDVKSKKYSDIHNAKLRVQKLNNLLGILLTKGLKQNAIFIAEKGLKIAQTYEFTAEQLFMARVLRTHTAAILGSHDEFRYYDQMLKECTERLNAELEVEGVFFELLIHYVNSKSTKPFIHEMSQKYLSQPDRLIPSKPSANWVYHLTMIKVVKYMSINEYEKTLAICEEGLAHIKALPFLHTKSIINISSQATSCCIQLRLYEKGEANILAGLEIMEKGIYNWFKYKELYVSLCFHTQRYQKAWSIFNEVTEHRKFKTLHDNVREVWKVYEAWLYFFINAGKITPCDEDKAQKRFRISRYANEVPIFFKDKRGLNVPILISQIMLLLQQKNYDLVIDRMEAIEKYKDRYVDKVHNLRSNIFIHMLLIIPKAYFKRKLVLEKTEKDRKKLAGIPLNMANQSADIEVLPYEDIWEILLLELK